MKSLATFVVFALVSSACGSESKATGVTVEIRSEVEVQLASVRVEVSNEAGTKQSEPEFFEVPRNRTDTFLLSFAVRPSPGTDEGSFVVTATGVDEAGTYRVQRRELLSFVPRTSRTITIWLHRNCVDVVCSDPKTTCSEIVALNGRGSCVPIDPEQTDDGATAGLDAAAGSNSPGDAQIGPGLPVDGKAVDDSGATDQPAMEVSFAQDAEVRDNYDGRDAGTDSNDSSAPPATDSRVVQLAAGGGHTCACLADGSVWCWGLNDYGQLGDGNRGGRGNPPVRASGITDATQVTAGASHTCARLAGGTVACWGLNDQGQLGDGTRATRSGPTPVVGLIGVEEVAAGASHTCARLAGGTVQCWGDNDFGQLGDGMTTDSPTPKHASVLVPILGDDTSDPMDVVDQIEAGDRHTCARVTGWGGVCWGDNSSGQLGNTPAYSAVEVEAGGVHSCFRYSDGQVHCQGSASSAGNGGSDSFWVLDIMSAVELAAGGDHSCARLSAGSVNCWGSNNHGQTGDGDFSQLSTVPAAVLDVMDAVELAAGAQHTCARLSTGSVMCWGANLDGQLGNGTMIDRSVPTIVLGLP